MRCLKDIGARRAVVGSDLESNVSRALGQPHAGLIDHFGCGACRAADLITIGDEIRDVEAAHSVGIPFGAVSWGSARPEGFAPSVMFAAVEDIPGHPVDP
jgi:phosphoglycolate phosphatase